MKKKYAQACVSHGAKPFFKSYYVKIKPRERTASKSLGENQFLLQHTLLKIFVG